MVVFDINGMLYYKNNENVDNSEKFLNLLVELNRQMIFSGINTQYL